MAEQNKPNVFITEGHRGQDFAPGKNMDPSVPRAGEIAVKTASLTSNGSNPLQGEWKTVGVMSEIEALDKSATLAERDAQFATAGSQRCEYSLGRNMKGEEVGRGTAIVNPGAGNDIVKRLEQDRGAKNVQCTSIAPTQNTIKQTRSVSPNQG